MNFLVLLLVLLVGELVIIILLVGAAETFLLLGTSATAVAIPAALAIGADLELRTPGGGIVVAAALAASLGGLGTLPALAQCGILQLELRGG